MGKSETKSACYKIRIGGINNNISDISIAILHLEHLPSSVVSDSLWCHDWEPARLLYPWDSPGNNTGVGWSGVGCHSLLQGIFPLKYVNGLITFDGSIRVEKMNSLGISISILLANIATLRTYSPVLHLNSHPSSSSARVDVWLLYSTF